jgi:8-oxo-dGTP pyrophosphatase MutT (NUDIX family)
MTTSRVGVILNRKDKYLCVFQSASKLWGFPKGRLRKFEKQKNGACRELREETGIFITPNYLTTNNMLHIKRGKHHHYYFLLSIDQEPDVYIDGYEIIDYRWLTIEELSKLHTSFFTEQVCKRLSKLNEMKNNILLTQ